jgi:peroxidase
MFKSTLLIICFLALVNCKRSMRSSSLTSRLLHNLYEQSSNQAARQIASITCPFQVAITCNSTAKYRTYDGTCNNLNNPILGSINTPYIRILSPAYGDGTDSPRNVSTVTGKALPNPRTISLSLSAPRSNQILVKNGLGQLYAQFGQFLTHDLLGTSETVDSSGNEFYCPCGSTSSNCISFSIPSPDPYLGLFCNSTISPTCSTGQISNQTCIQQTRSSATSPSLNCSTSYREQLNLLSAYIDGSTIYGINASRAAYLRTLSGGLLKSSTGLSGTISLLRNQLSETLTGRSYLPIDTNNTCSTCKTFSTCTTSSIIYNCFLAGEFRTSENLGLVSMHTLFMREHNRIALALAKINPTWNDETLYQETRRIVIAQLQHITYNEFVPQLVGDISLKPLQTNSYFTGYNSNVSPQIYSEFATSAFRMGHSLMRQQLDLSNINQNFTINANNNTGKNRFFPSYDLSESFFQSDMAYSNTTEGLNGVLLGILNNLAWEFGTYGTSLQNNLFQTTYSNGTKYAIDLFAFNINRGRDHGIQPYVNYIKQCFNITIKSFSDLSPKFMSKQSLQQLQAVYSDVNDIDLYAGGLKETIVSNWTIGPTFGCIIMQQFSNIKVADRFWYENGPSTSSTSFTLNQLQQIKNVTLAGLICNNYDIFTIPQQAFYISSRYNIFYIYIILF